MLGYNLDAVTAASVLIFPDKYHKTSLAAPKLQKLPLNIKQLWGFGCPVRKTGKRRPQKNL